MGLTRPKGGRCGFGPDHGRVSAQIYKAPEMSHPTPSGRPVKHSLTLRGHRTSVSLEAAFWQAFREIAADQKQSLNDLAARIDAQRGDVGLASAIRVFVLTTLQAKSV
jgi:predicted DNA-binding ribbon-helix-helix protein